MPAPSVADFAESLRRSRLLDAGQLDQVTRVLLPRFREPEALARELVRRGWLTTYQVNQLVQGRGDQLLFGSYVLLERIGSGGMGEVFKARNWKLGTVVALKLIRKEYLASEAAVRRFRREIRLAAQLDHPHIVRALDADEVGGRHFFVMEYVEGADLVKLVKQRGPMPIALACDFARQTALALQHAHERGLVHRDIKPANLLLVQGPESRSVGLIKVLDMGLAILPEPAGDGSSFETLTRDEAVIGSLDYIAPEQTMDAHAVDIRADLYGLGCTLYYLLTGRVPFPGGGPMDKLIGHRTSEPVPVEERRRDVPPGVAAVVRRLMAKRPDDRYQTPAEAAEALAAAEAEAPTVARRTAGTDPSSAAMEETTANWSSLLGGPTLAGSGANYRSRAERRRLLWVGAAAVVVLLGLVALLVVLLRRF